LGAQAEWTGDNEVRVRAGDLRKTEVDATLATRIRASFLLAGPLLTRHGRATLPPPGGDVIGRRRLDPHIHAFQQLGARIDGIESNVLRIQGVESLHGGEWSIGPEHIEVASFVGLAAVTGGELTIESCVPKDLQSILSNFAKLGVQVDVMEDAIHVP